MVVVQSAFRITVLPLKAQGHLNASGIAFTVIDFCQFLPCARSVAAHRDRRAPVARPNDPHGYRVLKYRDPARSVTFTVGEQQNLR